MCAGMYLAKQWDSYLVVDAGTAITCDVVVRGKHLVALLRQAYNNYKQFYCKTQIEFSHQMIG